MLVGFDYSVVENCIQAMQSSFSIIFYKTSWGHKILLFQKLVQYIASLNANNEVPCSYAESRWVPEW